MKDYRSKVIKTQMLKLASWKFWEHIWRVSPGCSILICLEVVGNRTFLERFYTSQPAVKGGDPHILYQTDRDKSLFALNGFLKSKLRQSCVKVTDDTAMILTIHQKRFYSSPVLGVFVVMISWMRDIQT